MKLIILTHKRLLLSLFLLLVTLFVAAAAADQLPLDDKYNRAFTDSLLRMTEKERNALDPDSNYILIYKFVPDNYGGNLTIPQFIKEVKSPQETGPSTYIENRLENPFTTTLLVIIYVSAIGWYLYRKSKLPVRSFIKLSWLIIFLIGAISWPMFSSIVFNTNELITRETGKRYRASVSYEKRVYKYRRRMMKKPTTRTDFYPTFNCYRTEEDNNYRMIKANRTTFKVFEEDGNDIIVCLNENRSQAAVLIPWHTKSNILWITVWTCLLSLLLLVTGKYINISKPK